MTIRNVVTSFGEWLRSWTFDPGSESVLCDICGTERELARKWSETTAATVRRLRRILTRRGWFNDGALDMDICDKCNHMEDEDLLDVDTREPQLEAAGAGC